MKLIFRLFVPAIFLVFSFVYGGQVISLDDTTTILKESEDIVLEHALNDYHHYYPKSCDVKLIDFTLSPVYKHQTIIDGNQTIDTVGGFAQTQFNIGDFYLRANTLFGKVTEKYTTTITNADKADKKETKEIKQPVTEIDDIMMRAGYDAYYNGDDHFGLYVMGSLPVRDIRAHLAVDLTAEQLKNIQIDTVSLELASPQLGVGNYKVGGGINGAMTLYDCDCSHCALLYDAQYNYALARTFAWFPAQCVVMSEGVEVQKEKQATTLKAFKDKEVAAQFTPGHNVNGWLAFHYAYCGWNLEVGSAFSTTFGEKFKFEGTNIAKQDDSKKTEAKVAPADNVKGDDIDLGIKLNTSSPQTIKLALKPYAAISYNTCIADNPLTVGVGVGYERNWLHREVAPRAFQGFSVWGTVALSF